VFVTSPLHANDVDVDLDFFKGAALPGSGPGPHFINVSFIKNGKDKIKGQLLSALATTLTILSQNVPGECAFMKGFSREACLTAWEKVSAAFGNTCTKKCLGDPKVRTSFGVGSDDYLNAVQMGNDLAVYALNKGGCDGDLLKGTIQQTKAPEVLMRPQLMERVKLLAEARTHSAKLVVTGGSHLMTIDFLMAACLKERELQIAALSKDKKARVQKFAVQQKALAILALKSLESQAVAEYANLTVAELDILIRYHSAVPKGGKQEKMAKWKAICYKGKKPAVCLPWTEPEEAVLVKLQTEEITMGDTHLGRQEETMKREMLIAGANMTDTHKNVKNIFLTFLIFELGDLKIYMSIR
jgi:hypothetical protein